jgi:hypothetical protein
MCCFTGKVEAVKNTRIFARVGPNGNQVVIYSMAVKSSRDVAMVLPVPVKPGSGENAMNFIDLSGYLSFFDDIEKHFLDTSSDPFAAATPPQRSVYKPVLKVVSVGAFDASYVPTIQDFSRLDARFRLPDDAWSQLPAYEKFGFAVFKLKAGSALIHPMAFSFPTATPKEVFYPTMHIHDGKIHKRAAFDHTLYGQGISSEEGGWEESRSLAGQFVKTRLTKLTVRSDLHIYRKSMVGTFTNGDVVVKVA